MVVFVGTPLRDALVACMPSFFSSSTVPEEPSTVLLMFCAAFSAAIPAMAMIILGLLLWRRRPSETTLLGLVTSKSRFLHMSKKAKQTADAAKAAASRYLAEGNEELARRTLHNYVADNKLSIEYAALADRTHRLAKALYSQPPQTVAGYASLIAAVGAAERNVATAAMKVSALEARMVTHALTQEPRVVPQGSGVSEANEVDVLLLDMQSMAALGSVGERLAALPAVKKRK